jgi:hypothetical protein
MPVQVTSLTAAMLINIGYAQGDVSNPCCGDSEGHNERVLIVLTFSGINGEQVVAIF